MFTDGPIFTVTRRGAKCLWLQGYMFRRHMDSGMKTRWYCATDYKFGCKAVLFTVNNTLIKVHNIHNHNPKIPDN